MCFGGQPEAPINKPSHSPEDSHKYVEIEKEQGGEKTKIRNAGLPEEPIKAPKRAVPTDDTIRM